MNFRITSVDISGLYRAFSIIIRMNYILSTDSSSFSFLHRQVVCLEPVGEYSARLSNVRSHGSLIGLHTSSRHGSTSIKRMHTPYISQFLTLFFRSLNLLQLSLFSAWLKQIKTVKVYELHDWLKQMKTAMLYVLEITKVYLNEKPHIVSYNLIGSWLFFIFARSKCKHE